MSSILGVTETAAFLGVSKQRVSQLAQRPDFPQPLAALACGKIWLQVDVEAFLISWDRAPGRRTK